MGKKVVSMSLNTKSVQNGILRIENYAKRIPKNSKLFVDLLAEKGIKIANAEKGNSAIGIKEFGTHQMENYVTFEKRLAKVDENGCTGYLVGIGNVFESRYTHDGQVIINKIKPLSMLEFGSAGFALPQQTKFGGSGGQGEMATQGNEGNYRWWFLDEDGNPKMGTSISPSRPMLKAWNGMIRDIKDCERKAFS